MSGKWYLGTRGSNPKLWDPWRWIQLEGYGPASTPSLGDLAKLIKWGEMGQHVCLEFIPDGVIDPEDK